MLGRTDPAWDRHTAPATSQTSGHTGSAAPSVRERVRNLVAGILATRSAPATFADDTTLTEIGIASLDMVKLLLAVESEFDLEVPQDDITADAFRSVATIDALIRRLLPA